MHLHSIRSKRTYWTVRRELAGNASLCREVKSSHYVVLVDFGEKRLFVSTNGRPPVWIGASKVADWLEWEPHCRGWYEIEYRETKSKKRQDSLVVA